MTNKNNDKEFNKEELNKALWDASNHMRNGLSAQDYLQFVMGILLIKHLTESWKSNYGSNTPNASQIEEAAELGYYYIDEKYNWDSVLEEAKKDKTERKLGEMITNSLRWLLDNHLSLKWLPTSDEYNSMDDRGNSLVEIIKIFSTFKSDSKSILISDIYEFFIGEFFKRTAQKGGEFFTPSEIIELMYRMMDIDLGKNGTNIYDPASGVGGMLIKPFAYLKQKYPNNKNMDENVLAFGQEINKTVYGLGKLNFLLSGLALRDASGKDVLGEVPDSTLTNDQHIDLKFHYIMANPPFNLKKYGHELLDCGVVGTRFPKPLPTANANYAWLSHIVFHMTDEEGETSRAGCVLTPTTLSSSSKHEIAYRKDWVENDYIEAIIALPERLFLNTSIPSTIWFFNKNKVKNKDKVLFIDLSKDKDLVKVENKTLNSLRKETIERVSKIIREFRETGEDVNIEGLCKSISNEEILKDNYVSLAVNQFIEYSSTEVPIEELLKNLETLDERIENNWEKIDEIRTFLNSEKEEFNSLLKSTNINGKKND